MVAVANRFWVTGTEMRRVAQDREQWAAAGAPRCSSCVRPVKIREAAAVTAAPLSTE